MDPTANYYHLANTFTNELVFAKWTRCPSRHQIQTIRHKFGWAYDDELELRGRKKQFRLIGDSTLIFKSNIGYSHIIPDRSYLVIFESKDSIRKTIMVESYEEILDLIEYIS